MYKTIGITIPHGLDREKVVEMFNFDGILVDDTCSVNRYGRDVILWIPEDQLKEGKPEEKAGYFWGRQMGP